MKEIKDFEDYLIYEDGRVFSKKTNKFLKQQVNRYGYQTVKITNKTQFKHHSIHRLVANAYIDNLDCKKEVNHINGNKLDNNVSNLEWATRQENQIHAFKTGLQVVNKNTTEAAKRAISKKVLDLRTGICYPSIKEAALSNNLIPQSLSEMLHGKYKNKTTLKFI